MEEESKSVTVRMMPCKKDLTGIVGCEDERGRNQGIRILESGKERETDSPLETLGRNAVLLTP